MTCIFCSKPIKAFDDGKILVLDARPNAVAEYACLRCFSFVERHRACLMSMTRDLNG